MDSGAAGGYDQHLGQFQCPRTHYGSWGSAAKRRFCWARRNDFAAFNVYCFFIRVHLLYSFFLTKAEANGQDWKV